MSTKISALAAATALDGTEVLPVVQAAATVKATVQQVVTATTGSTVMSGATVVASAPLINLAQTWNNAAVTFTGFKFNVTSTASAAASLLFDLQVGGVSKLNVDKIGTVIAANAGAFAFTGTSFPCGISNAQNNDAVTIYTQNRIQAYCTQDRFSVPNGAPYGFSSTNAANGTRDAGVARVGPGVTAACDGINGTTYRDFKLRTLFVSGDVGSYIQTPSMTVANLAVAATAGAGARAFVTDASTTITLGLGLTVAGGGANKVPVYCDGTNWIIG